MSFFKSAALAATLTVAAASTASATTIFNETSVAVGGPFIPGYVFTSFTIEVPTDGEYLFEITPVSETASVLYSVNSTGSSNLEDFFSGDSFTANLTGDFNPTGVDYSLFVGVTGEAPTNVTLTVSEVPLPAALPLLAGALGFGGFVARRKRRQAA